MSSIVELVRTRRPATTGRQDLITVALGTWLVVGVFVDGWAHVNKTSLETFFTPWHAVLYSGATVLFAYLFLLMRRSGGIPAGYLPAVLGGPLFLLGGAGDFLWHQVFGIEVGIDALLSPTHLLLLVSALMVLGSPWRADTARGHASLPGVAGLALSTAMAAFFLLYASAFTNPWASESITRIPEGAPGHEAAELPASAGLAGYLVTTVLLVFVVLLLSRRGPLPVGAATMVLVLVAGLSVAVVEFRQPLTPIAALVAGIALDVVLVRTATWDPRRRTLVVAAALPALLWPLQLVGIAITDGLRWPVELWTGVVLLTVGAALAAGWLSLGPAASRVMELRGTAATPVG